jgi:hypothetical protein
LHTHSPDPKDDMRLLKEFLRPALLGASLLALGSVCRAEITIANFLTNTGNDGRQTPGQEVTTPGGLPWDNITFNFIDSLSTATPGDPYAAGILYLLSAPYTGLPSALSTSTPGFIAEATASADIWTFGPGVTLQPNTSYFFYMSTHPPADTIANNTSGKTAGETSYGAANGTGAFAVRNFTLDFELDGTAVPEPSTVLPVLAGLAVLATRLRRFSRTLTRTDPNSCLPK